MPAKASEDNFIYTDAFARVSKNINMQDYPRPATYNQGGAVKFEHALPPASIQEKSKSISYSVIAPVSNIFVGNNGKTTTEFTPGIGLSAPFPTEYPILKDMGAFAIVSNNLKDATTFVGGVGYVRGKNVGDFQLNLGVSGEVVCVEHGDKSKIAPNPHIGTCDLFPSAYSSIVYTPEKDNFLKNTGFQAIVTPALARNQDNVFTLGFFRRF